MHTFPLLHGSAGYFDEIIVIVEAILILVLLIAYLRSRKRGKPSSPDVSPPPSAEQ